MVIVKSFSDEPKLTRGTEILAINGVPAKTILTKLLTIARADGSNDAKRVASLEFLGGDRYETFDIYFPLFFPQTSIKLNLTVRPFASKKAFEIVVDALTYEQRLNAMPVAAESTKSDEKVPPFRLGGPRPPAKARGVSAKTCRRAGFARHLTRVARWPHPADGV